MVLIKKFMKKVITAIAIGVIVITPINAFAAETTQTKDVDGSTIEKNLFLSIAGDYHIYAQPWSGTTNGQSSYFDFNITW